MTLISINSIKHPVHFCSYVPKFGTELTPRAAMDEHIELEPSFH